MVGRVSEGWSTAYVAVSVALGEPLDLALGSFSTSSGVASEVLEPRCAALVAALRSSSRERRVQALARALAETALDVDVAGLA